MLRAGAAMLCWVALGPWLAACSSSVGGLTSCEKDAECTAPATCGGGGQGGVCGCPDRDGDGYSCDDCDDHDPDVNPSRSEVCDYKDNDCNGVNDDGVDKVFYADLDHDGYGNPESATTTCFPSSGTVKEGGDCNDLDPTVHPTRKEVCDYKDNDCNGAVDESVTLTYYRDADGDGYGDPNNRIVGCQQPSSFVSVGGDCDDSRADTNPGAVELCNARDDDCNGSVDGNTRVCDNACGPGVETCSGGLYGGCTAPVVTTISTATQVTGPGTASFECLKVTGKLTVAADVTVHASNWIRVEGSGSIDLGARATLDAAGNLAFVGSGAMNATDGTVQAGGTVSLEPDARWLVKAYSGGGAASCTDGGPQGVGGAGGGARGGGGGRGGTCGVSQTQPTSGAGGASAQSGADGCDCDCSATAAGGGVSGGDGGAAMAGGAGGGNGGAGGAGADGRINLTTYSGGIAGGIEPLAGVPAYGGGAGGSGGTAFSTDDREACQGAGGAGAGILRVHALSFLNRGLVLADGQTAPDVIAAYEGGFHAGGGGGAGGTLVFRVGTYESTGSVSAVGGGGGDSMIVPCGVSQAGGGGGGGGGIIYVGGPLGGGAATVVALGNNFVGGGAGGLGICGAAAGAAGSPGLVIVAP